MTSLPAKVLIAPIRFYQRFITPYTPATCVYYPTCSAYAVTALRTHGAIVGTGLTIWRLLRCNPWSSGGIDKVPSKQQLWHRHGPDDHDDSGQNAAGAATVRAGLTDAENPEAEGSGADERTPAAAENMSTARARDENAGNPRERGGAVASSTTACCAEPRSAGTDCDLPPSAARLPMIGRSAA